MAIFLKVYLYVPETDRKKTILREGNADRLDHQIIGASLTQASLYKFPKKPKISQYWLWDDPGFDPLDPEPSERLVLKDVYDRINQEMERMQQDKKNSFSSHYVVGDQVHQQLGFLYTRAKYHMIGPEELINFIFLGANVIDLGQVGVMIEGNRKTLKPDFLPSLTKKLSTGKISKLADVQDCFEKFRFDDIEKLTEPDILTLLQTYHRLRKH